MNNMTKELGKRIRTERIDKKMTQEELAERAGLHPTYIGQVERGEKSLTITSLEKIVEGLGISFLICLRIFSHRQSRPALRCDAMIKSTVTRRKSKSSFTNYFAQLKN